MMPNPTDAIRVPILALLLFEMFALFCRSWLQVELTELGYGERRARDLSYFVVPVILVALGFPVLRAHRAFLATMLAPRRVTLRLLLTGLAIGVLMRIAWWCQLVAGVSLGIVRDPDPGAIVGPMFVFSCPPVSTLLLYLLVMSVLVPVIEETISRGFYLHGLLALGKTTAATASSVLFAIMHDPEALPSAFAMGLVLAMLVLHAGSLWPAIAAHATYNGLIALDWICLRGVWNPESVTPVGQLIGLAAATLFLLSVLAVMLLVFKAAPAFSRTPAPSG